MRATKFSLARGKAILLLLLCVGAVPAYALPSLKTMSFNIRADFEFGNPSSAANAWIATSAENRRDLATAVIADYAPDIVGVQEAFHNQVLDLRSALSEYSFYGVGRNDGATSGEYSGIFYDSTRFEQSEQGTFWLSLSPDQPSVYPGGPTFRIASWVKLIDCEAAGREYFVLNSHWAQGFGGTAAREYSAGLVRDRLAALADDLPVIVMGDLNAFDFQPAFTDLLGASDLTGLQLEDSYREIFPDKGPDERTNHGFIGHIDGQRIDYLLHSREFSTTAAEIVHINFDGRYPSDHYPITATLELSPLGAFDADGDVDGNDFLMWQRGLSPRPLSGVDLSAWQENYSHTGTASAAAATVPEPGSLVLLTVGLLLFRVMAHPLPDSTNGSLWPKFWPTCY